MEITLEEVRRIARLAQLELDEGEVRTMARQLADVLGHFEQLRGLDTEGVAPTSHVLDLANRLRADEPRPSLAPDEAVSGAPSSEAGHFRVPPVL